MKYLKKFNEASNIEDIKDILLEIEDDHYDIFIYDHKHLVSDRHGSSTISISSHNHYDKLNWDDIKDCCLRLKDYLGDNFIKFENFEGTLNSNGNYRWKEIELNEHTQIDSEKVIISYKP